LLLLKLFLLASILWRELAASWEYKCSRDSVASFEAFFACSFFSRKAASLGQMLKISPASYEAFFACLNSLKGTCCKFSSNPWKFFLLQILKLFCLCFLSRKAASLIHKTKSWPLSLFLLL
jgi:hypothetical protein